MKRTAKKKTNKAPLHLVQRCAGHDIDADEPVTRTIALHAKDAAWLAKGMPHALHLTVEDGALTVAQVRVTLVSDAERVAKIKRAGKKVA